MIPAANPAEMTTGARAAEFCAEDSPRSNEDDADERQDVWRVIPKAFFTCVSVAVAGISAV
jgi:hypothetical protein